MLTCDCLPFCFSSNFSAFEFCYFVVAFLSIYACANSSIDRAEWLHETSWLGQLSWLAFQNEPARFHLISCNREVISTKFSTDCRVDFKMKHNGVPSYKRASSPYVITPLVYGVLLSEYYWFCFRISFSQLMKLYNECTEVGSIFNCDSLFNAVSVSCWNSP